MEDLWHNDKIMLTNNLKKSYNYCFNDIFQKCQSILFNNTYRVLMEKAMAPPLQYSYLENPMGRGAWQAAVHGVVKSRTRLSDFTFTFHFHALEKEMATHSSALAWRIPGMRTLVGCHLWGRIESDTTEATQQQHRVLIGAASGKEHSCQCRRCKRC